MPSKDIAELYSLIQKTRSSMEKEDLVAARIYMDQIYALVGSVPLLDVAQLEGELGTLELLSRNI